MKCIAYNGGYKYQLKETYTIAIDIKPSLPIGTEYIDLDVNGNLTIREGYAWDGPSGPTIDTLNFMRGSLVHDALYQLMREGHLDHHLHRETATASFNKFAKKTECGLCAHGGFTKVFDFLPIPLLIQRQSGHSRERQKVISSET